MSASRWPDPAPLYQTLNAQFFGAELPLCQLRWSRRLTRAAGNIRVQSRMISLSVPLLIDAFADGASHQICGVSCATREEALCEILKHEMIHLWLFERGLPCGHTPQFRAKARQLGQNATRHAIDLPIVKGGWIYCCPHCAAQITRRRRLNRVGACAACCKKYSGGKFDARFALRGQRI